MSRSRRCAADGVPPAGYVRDGVERVTPSVLAARAAALQIGHDLAHLGRLIRWALQQERRTAPMPAG
ncbi:hypothetical protein [Actinoallomurus iriomotensis]|nr:hypothetical protein [Actinoallomurus iriomotensis]